MDAAFLAFIDLERWRFETRASNLFHMAFREIPTYRLFLSNIQGRTEAIGAEYSTSLDAHFKSLEGRGSGALAPDELALLQRLGDLGLALRFEIECFYLFAYILLDKVAGAIAFYFEGNASTGWHKHGALVKKFSGYAQVKGLAMPDGFVAQATALGSSIADFRNFQIVHESGLRAIRGTGFRTGEGPRLTLSNLYPTGPDLEHDPQRQSRPMGELVAEIDQYLTAVIELVVLNRERTPLLLEGKG